MNSMPEDAFTHGTYTGDHIAAETLEHYREHREDIERWSGSEG